MTKKCPDNYNKLIIEKRKCIDDCSKDNLYRFEYNNICYLIYPEISTIVTTSTSSDIYELYSESNIPTIIPNITEIYEKDKTIEPSTYITYETTELIEKDKKVNLSTYIAYETTVINNIINKCTTHELSNGLCKLDSNNNGNNMEEKDAIVSNIRELISKGGLDSILLNMINENNENSKIMYTIKGLKK